MYHQISNDPSRLGAYVISEYEFEEDLKLLKKYGYKPITVKQLLKYSSGRDRLPDKPVMLTFDDGFESDYVYAFPLLKKYNVKAVFSVIGKYADYYSQDVPKHLSYSHLSWAQIKEMHKSGHAEFQSHSYDLHSIENRRGALKKKNESPENYQKIMAYDLGRLNKAYGDNAGVNPKGFACPFGYYNDTLKETVKNCGFKAILTSNESLNKLTGDPEELYRLGRFVRQHNKNVEKLILSLERTIESEKPPES